jgi:hypothetical protein
MKKNKQSFLLTLICLFSAFQLSHAQSLDSLLANKRVYYTMNIGNHPPPKIDGDLNDSIWFLGEWHGDFTQQQPYAGVEGTENTYIKVLYDRSNLYVAIICQDSEPEKIRDIFDRRDALNGDMTGIAIDSYYDKRTAFEFNLSAAGQKMDLKHLGDYQWDFNWDAVWDGATAKNDSGWVAEMEIPFSQMRYTNQEEHLWGMHVWRWISRRFEEDQWQYIPKEAPAMVYLFGELKGVKNIRGSRQVEFLPYVLSAVRNPAGEGGFDPLKFNGGLDAKVGISSDYTLDLSINPDFGQVEADPSVLNLTSFETFYEEKRPFFLEGNEIFDFQLGQDIPYYSRRIGSAPSFPGQYDRFSISEVPNRTTILGAAKLTGKSSRGLSVGLVNGLTAEAVGLAKDESGAEEEIQVAPLSNYLASRVKREFNDANTMVGGMFNLVNRISPDSAILELKPSSAVTGGLDLQHYWNNKNYFFEVKTIASQLKGSTESIFQKQRAHTHRFQRPDADYLSVDSLSEHLNGHGGMIQVGKKGGALNFSLTGEYRSPGLNLNDMGYIRQADFFGEGLELVYKMNEPGDWVRSYELILSQDARWSFGGENIQNEIGSFFTLVSNNSWRYLATYNYAFSHLDIRELRGGPALRIDGEHLSGVLIASNSAKDLSARAGFHYNVFGESGSHQEIAHATLTWLPIRKIKLSGRVVFNNQKYHQQYVGVVSGTGGDEFLVSHIDHRTTSFTFRGELFLSPELSLQYYGSPYYSVGDYSDFQRVNNPSEKDISARLEPITVGYDAGENSYTFDHGGESLEFDNPDFSFMQFRSNLVFRWEYNLGSTLYLVWAHDRSGWESQFNPVSEITGDLFGIKGNNVFMFKMNFWFSI